MTDPSGKPVRGVKVEAKPTAGMTLREQTSDTGVFAIHGGVNSSMATYTVTDMTRTYTSASQVVTTGDSADYAATPGNRRVDFTGFAGRPAVITATPEIVATVTGRPGGPFVRGSATCTLTNTGGDLADWEVDSCPSWITLSKTLGTQAAARGGGCGSAVGPFNTVLFLSLSVLGLADMKIRCRPGRTATRRDCPG